MRVKDVATFCFIVQHSLGLDTLMGATVAGDETQELTVK